MLADRAGVLRQHSNVLVTMVPAFALTDYEWLQALESDRVGDLIDLTRALRTSVSGAHIRDEPPYYTGRRLDFTDVIEVLR
jgi:chlorite dismutase